MLLLLTPRTARVSDFLCITDLINCLIMDSAYTWSQPDTLPATSTLPWTPRIPASSNCVTYSSEELFGTVSSFLIYPFSMGSLTLNIYQMPTSSATGSAAKATGTGASGSAKATGSGSKTASGSAASSTSSSGAGKLAVGSGLMVVLGAAAALL
jgi:hypothetical protein